MILPLERRAHSADWEVIRARMLRETELFLAEGLGQPERHRRIPAIRWGESRFARGFVAVFWLQMLAST